VSVRFDSASKRAAARVGRSIKDKWTLDRLIGVGGMAAVYAATHRNKKQAAIKMLHPELSLDPVVRDRFLREGYASNSVGHSGAVRVDDDDVAEDGCAYIVMELLDGETVEQRWQRKNYRLPPEEVLSLMDQLLDTLNHAHEKGIVHRDIKPENLFLTRDGAVKVLDFGIARLHELTGLVTSTQTGNTMGTPAFMAPEQARARWEDVDARTDLWAVGATMFTLLTGQFVHEGETVNETLAMAVTQPARSLSSLRPDLHPALIALVDRALAYDKAKRWPDATTMQEALRHVYLELQGVDVSVAPQLEVPIESQALPNVKVSSEFDPRKLLGMFPLEADSRAVTTARGVTASSPTKRFAPALRRRLVIGAALLCVPAIGILAWALSGGDPEGPLAGSGSLSSEPVPPAPPASVASAKFAASSEPAPLSVKLEELPKETVKGSKAGKSAKTPASATSSKKSSDPFARRR
jgi:serine/threonine protein kinase